MAPYELTHDAEHDLLDIAIYTLETWGIDQADRYESALVKHFEDLGRGDVRTSTPIPHRPKLRASLCMHHYVFSLHNENDAPLILAVLHEQMDLMARLAERLDTD